jgi:hypothetical protein
MLKDSDGGRNSRGKNQSVELIRRNSRGRNMNQRWGRSQLVGVIFFALGVAAGTPSRGRFFGFGLHGPKVVSCRNDREQQK